MPTPKRPSLCTHIKVTGHRCGSPALRGEFFCYFHTRIIKGVQQRVDMRLDAMALLENSESIQLSIMHVVDGLVKGTLDPTRARLIIQALRIAARNAKNVRFDKANYLSFEPPMVREIPDYARQYLIEHPELGPPLSTCGAGAPAREHSEKTEPRAAPEPAAKRRQNAAQGATSGSNPEPDPVPKERKKPSGNADDAKERQLIQQAEAAMEGAQRGNWRDLRTVFEFAGLSAQDKEAPR